MTRLRRGAAPAALIALAACTATPLAEPPVARGFLAPEAAATLTAEVLVPPPVVGADLEAALRLAGSTREDRRLIAVAHAEMRPALARQHFDCALDARLAASETAALTALMTRLAADVRFALDALPGEAGRRRPMAASPELAVCLNLPHAQAERLAQSPARASAQAALGAAWAGALARIAPDRAVALDHVGAELGRSAAICNIDWMSDVHAGAAVGRAVLARVETEPEFATLLEQARTEVAAARASGRTNPGCAAERAARDDGRS